MCSTWGSIVHSSSESIGTIAAALAKAQAELTNPEKSLVATIRSPFPREGDRRFRYAPLSSGLDIVRKSLGKHEIATIQATAIDKVAGLLRLTTVLAHSSGEWISSEWPVCQITEIASAQRMGAALTYARRYALFTLVGIAGEDDLDAPDLEAGSKFEVEVPRPTQADGHGGLASRPRDGGNSAASARPVLGFDESATLRERLVAELLVIDSADEAAAWAHRSLPVKNSLTAEDAQIVEAEFKARLSNISDGLSAEGPLNDGLNQRVPLTDQLAADTTQKTSTVTKQRTRGAAVHGLAKTVRLRDKNHRKFVTRQPCLVCGRVEALPSRII
jgi:ERF superfamily